MCVSRSVMSDFLRPHGLLPALCPWNSPGKNTGVGGKIKKNAGVGSYSLLQGNLPHPGIEPESLTLQVDSLPSEPPGKSLLLFLYLQYLYKAVIIS